MICETIINVQIRKSEGFIALFFLKQPSLVYYQSIMSATEEISTLKGVLEKIQKSSLRRENVSIGDILDIVGRRSFGPILLIAGLITVAPIIGDVPGVPTVMGIIVFLVASQILVKRKKLWLPRAILNRSIKKDTLHRAIKKLYKPAGYVDKLIKPRLQWITTGVMVYPAALVCLGISLAMPLMEFIPFSANFAGAALTAFGLSFTAKDGLMALFGYFFTTSIVAFIAYNVM